MTTADPAGLLRLAVDVAEEAGELLLGYARAGGLSVSTKSTPTDPVSEADRAAERLIADRLLAARPLDGLVGEEATANREGTSGLRWIVDPLDGTVNYLYGLGQWAVSVGVADADGPLAGAVVDPCRGEVFAAARGAGATLDGRPLRMDPIASLPGALVATGFGYDADVRRAQAAMVTDLIGDIRDIRRLGSAALDLCWVAAGRYDGYAEFGVNAWDIAAGTVVAAEAGATVTAWDIQLADRVRSGVVAAGPTVHDGLAAWLTRHGATRR